ncbi:MAG TPA: sigma 54-interacting transcriptional regulator, partial [Phycisphaerae bacterium]|nr:sigma 54-interacting transcriptional regulator [Phycisphaerae bacterium]
MYAVSAQRESPRAPSSPVVPRLVGSDGCVLELWSGIKAVCSRSSTVLICGESGSGKELTARHLHAAGPRRDKPFVTVDCTTLRDTLFESQLFGHAKGAFTGAEHATLGLFRAADGGTLFLDEVGELRLDLQAKLLRCLQDGAVVPLGAVAPIAVDVRIIAATNRDLAEMVTRGQFRPDLYFRLNVVRLDVPPLRDRPNDILPLANHFLAELGQTYDEPAKSLADTARAALLGYRWPGNVRELRNAVEHAVAFCASECITAADLPRALRDVFRRSAPAAAESSSGRRRVVTLEAAERCLLRRALRTTHGNKSLAAKLLGIERHRLAR